MLKSEVIEYFGGKQNEVAKALGRTRASVNGWPEVLPLSVQNLIIGTLLRRGDTIPPHWLEKDIFE
ncbi:MAG: hypothetical protein IBX56_05365 [Methylomicrobium sp.]|nr:hypothetical protein [Methylomicrobium sp.]